MTGIKPLRDLLTAKLLARLAMRWKEANAHIPPGGAKVLCAQPLPDAEREDFDMYVLAYRDAIEDALDMLDKSSGKPERPLALAMAEASVFQGGALPPQAVARGKRRQDPSKSRGRRPFSAARQKAEELFSGGGQ